MEMAASAALKLRLPGELRRLEEFGRRAKIGARRVHMLSDLTKWDPAAQVAAIATRGDRAAFVALFGFYAPRIKGFLMRSGTAADVAEEIAQEAMLAVWRKAATFDPARAGVSTWIYTIARNLRIDRLRHERGVSADALHDALDSDEPQRPDDIVQGAERDERVRAAMKDLSAEQREVVRLSFFEDKPHAEIAETLGIPLGTVKSRLRLAMARLRQRLDELS
jgi:RNA polymerase sigma-70 factor (ECF subfamily)